MSKLVLVTDTELPDQLLLLAPDNYDKNDLYKTCGKMGMLIIDIHETVLPERITEALRDMGLKEWREHWG